MTEDQLVKLRELIYGACVDRRLAIEEANALLRAVDRAVRDFYLNNADKLNRVNKLK